MANTTNALTDEQKANLQRSRILEERLLCWIDEMQADPANYAGTSMRSLSIARTNLQTAFMWLNHAICKPPRLNLEEEDAAQA